MSAAHSGLSLQEKCISRFDESDRGWVGSFATDKNSVISGHQDGAVCVFDIRKKKSVVLLQHHTGNIQQVPEYCRATSL